MINEIIIEYDNIRLENLSNQIYNLFIENNYNTILLNNTISLEEKILIIKEKNKAFILSNKINTIDANAIEIIYPLRSTNNLAISLENALNDIKVSKYYQKRASGNTALDYYEILRNINNNETIIIRFGLNTLNNVNLAEIIYQTLIKYFRQENFYIVKSGDSLYSIAKRFNTSVDNLKKINNLSSNNLAIGQTLIIPNSNEQMQNNNNDNSNSSNNTYTVQSGDSLYAIAKRFNTSVDNLKRINNLSSNNLAIGQKLIIPNSNEQMQNNNNNNNNNNSNNTYTVQSGDSLYAIAKRFNTSVDNLKRINNLSSNNLSIGQKLIIPNNLDNSNTNTYIVKSGDNLYSIAKRFNTTVNDIKSLNKLSNNTLSIGQKLIIP